MGTQQRPEGSFTLASPAAGRWVLFLPSLLGEKKHANLMSLTSGEEAGGQEHRLLGQGLPP